MIKWKEKIFGLDNDFKRIFFRNELRTLRGKSSRGILALCLILFFTLTALAFAIGGYKYLSKRMDNPFTNWVNLRVTRSVDQLKGPIMTQFGSTRAKEQFNLKEINSYQLYYAPFLTAAHSEMTLKGSTIKSDSELLPEILAESNLVRSYDKSQYTEDENELGLIITEEFFSRLGYKNSNRTRIAMTLDDKRVHLPIHHVVKSLPNLTDFIASADVYALYRSKYSGSGLATNFEYISTLSPDEMATFQEKNKQVYNVRSEEYELGAAQPYYLHRVTLNTLVPDSTMNAYIKSINTQFSSRGYRFYKISDFELDRGAYYPTDLAFVFENTRKVRSFSDTLKQKMAVDIDMSQVESKENFALVSTLTQIISAALFILSILSIVFFIDSLLKTHLEKAKTNLGTFKAFGLDNAFLTGIYLKIIMNFLLFALFIAFILTSILGIVEHFIAGNNSRFDLYNPLILIALVALITFVYFYSRRTIRKILSHTPGDLIYRRV